MNKETFYRITAELKRILLGSEFDGHVYAVGGSVRDLVMGNEIKDIDLVVDLDNGGIRLAHWLDDNGWLHQKVVTYPTFGTAMFKLSGFPEHEIEAVYTRGEKYTKGSRNPETVFCSIQDDAFRRDLTINALYYNISNGEIVDFTGKGMDDIATHTIRVTNDNPDIVFTDDPLRILRVVRFASRYGWEIEKATYDSMVLNAGSLSIISQERKTAEFTNMLMCERVEYALALLNSVLGDDYGLVFGEQWPTVKCSFLQRAALVKDSEQDLCIRLGILFFWRDRDVVREILTHLKYPNVVIDEVLAIIDTDSLGELAEAVCNPSDWLSYVIAKHQYRCGDKDRFWRFLQVFRAERMMCIGDEYTVEGLLDRISDLTESRNLDMYAYKLPVDGDDIMELLGCGPCRMVKEVKDFLLDVAFQNPSLTREECIGLINDNFTKKTEL